MTETFDDEMTMDGLVAMGLATRTVVMYMRTLRRSAAWCNARDLDMATLTALQTRELSESWPLTTGSRSQLRSSLGRYWELQGRLDGPTKAVRVPRRLPMVCAALEDPDAALLAKTAGARGDRRGLAVLIGIYMGLRRAEIARLRWGDLDDGWIRVLGKGDRQRMVPVHPEVEPALLRAAKARRRDPVWLFPGRFGGPVNPSTIWQWCRDLSEEAIGLRVRTHVLRHTALAAANDGTGDLRAVQELAGHAKPETTAGYTRASRRRVLAAVHAIRYDEQEAS